MRAPIDTRGRFHSRTSDIAWTIASKSGVTIWENILAKSWKLSKLRFSQTESKFTN